MSRFELAQINIARFVHPKEHAINAPFMDALDEVNAKAEAVPGDPRLIVNMSVWKDLASLGAFAYRNSEHVAVFRRKHEWFEPMEVALALWWVPAGHRPDAAEGMARIEKLASLGPTHDAFTFKSPFPPPAA